MVWHWIQLIPSQGKNRRPYPTDSAPGRIRWCPPVWQPNVYNVLHRRPAIETLYHIYWGKSRGIFVEDFYMLDVQRLRSTYSPFVNQQKTEMSQFLGWTSYGTSTCFSSWICMCFFFQPMKIWLHSANKGLYTSLFLLGNTNSLSLFLRGV